MSLLQDIGESKSKQVQRQSTTVTDTVTHGRATLKHPHSYSSENSDVREPAESRVFAAVVYSPSLSASAALQEEDKIILREVEVLKQKMPERDVPWVID